MRAVTARPIRRCPRLALLGLAMGLLGCKSPPDPSGPRQQATAHAGEAPGFEAVPLELEAPPQQLEPSHPPLSPAALAARFEAQRALLPDRNLFEDLDGRPVPWIPPHDEPVMAAVLPENPGGFSERRHDDDWLTNLPGSSGLGGPDEAPAGERVNGNALGLFEPIGDPPRGPALARFYEALRALEAGKDEDGKVRVLVYGASHTDADVYPHYLRTYLQERFGDGGHGFVHVAKPWNWYSHHDIEVEGLRGWKTEHAQRTDGRADGLYGLLGASLATRSRRAFGRITHRAASVGARYEIYFLAQPRGGSFRVMVDGRRAGTVSTRAPEIRAGYHAIELPEGPHAIEIQPVGNGEIRMFGLTIEREAPGVVVDTLGIGGTRAANMLAWDEAVWADNVRRRDPALIVLAYGTNEATDSDQPIDVYIERLRQVVARLQAAAPQASCLLVGPGDFPQEIAQGHWVPRPRLSEIVAAQERVAREAGCGFWDTLAFMGGELSMVQWVRAQPQMGKSDHIHLTRRGYVRMGMALTDAMMIGFDEGDVLSETRLSAR